MEIFFVFISVLGSSAQTEKIYFSHDFLSKVQVNIFGQCKGVRSNTIATNIPPRHAR